MTPVTVSRALALSLNISEDFFLDIHKALLRGGGSFCKLRSLYYPAIANVKPGVTRCGEHSDYGTLTFLFQDSLGGLQIRGVGGEWVDAEPVEGSILVGRQVWVIRWVLDCVNHSPCHTIPIAGVSSRNLAPIVLGPDSIGV